MYQTDMYENLSCPLLGLFGSDDRSPTPDQVARHEKELKKQGKTYAFHMYSGAALGAFPPEIIQLSPFAAR